MAPASPSQDRVSADDQQAPHLRIASLADPAELLPLSTRELSRNKANPRCEMSSGSELGGVADRSRDERSGDRTDARDRREATATSLAR